MKTPRRLWKDKVKNALLWGMLISLIVNFFAYQPLLIAESYVDAMYLYDSWVMMSISKQTLSGLECHQLAIKSKNHWPYTVKITAEINKENGSFFSYVTVALAGIDLVSVSSAIQPTPEYIVL